VDTEKFIGHLSGKEIPFIIIIII